MMAAILTILLGVVVYFAPLCFGRACIAVGCIAWPLGWILLLIGVVDLLQAVPA